MTVRIVLIHGAATDSRVWRSTVDSLRARAGHEAEIVTPDRPQSGDLDAECAALAPLCADSCVVGVSGGATLGLELAARGVPMTGALLHEPAAGSLAPGLLAHVAEALAADGVDGFGRTLYGELWEPSACRVAREVVEAELAMFGRFEPRPLAIAPDRVRLTVGERSPAGRWDSVRALSDHLGAPWGVLAGASHAAHLENRLWPEILALAGLRDAARRAPSTTA